MAEEKIRLGGMALANGVLVHGPTAWACAIRTDDGELKVVARRKRFSAIYGRWCYARPSDGLNRRHQSDPHQGLTEGWKSCSPSTL